MAEKISFKRYPLKKAETPSEFIKATLDRSTPIHLGTRPHHSTTNWTMSFQVGECANSLLVTLDAQAIIPEAKGGSAAYREQLLKYAEALEQHEKGVIEVLRKEAAKADKSLLSGIPAGLTCKQRADLAKQRTVTATEAAKSSVLAYNLKTRFGWQQSTALVPIQTKPPAPVCNSKYQQMRDSIIKQLNTGT